jgi:deazaflavin-dependent oxidoreductase (nitroreductase family)
MSKLNGPVAWVLRSRLHPLLSFGLMLLTWTGRRSGRRYTIPVGYQRLGNSIRVLVSRPHRKQWWRNFREPAAVEVRFRGTSLLGRARVVPSDAPEFREAIAETLRRLPFLGRQFGIGSPRGGHLSEAQWQRVCAQAVLVVIALEPA